MKSLIFTFFIAFLCIWGCKNKDSKIEDHSNIPIEEQTPETLLEDESYSDFDSFSSSKRYHNDIIDLLYKEALSKDENLDALNKQIIDMYEKKVDTSEAYKKYTQKNTEYWHSVNNYLEQINDSTIKNQTKTFFDKLENDYKKSIASHEQKKKELESKAQALNNQLILMKLLITAPMMKNYQINELPSLDPFSNLIKEYDTLLQKTEEHITY